MKSTITILFICLFVAGCTNKQLYETIQEDNLRQCKNKSQTYEQYTECEAMYGKSYEQYKDMTQ